MVNYLNLSKKVNIESINEVSDYELVVELFMGGGIELFKKRIRNVFESHTAHKDNILKILCKLNNLDMSHKARMILIFTKKVNASNEERKNKIELEDISLLELTESLSQRIFESLIAY